MAGANSLKGESYKRNTFTSRYIRVEKGDDDPICVTKEGGASGQSKRDYINYCVSSSFMSFTSLNTQILFIQIPTTTTTRDAHARACRWGRYSNPNLPTL